MCDIPQVANLTFINYIELFSVSPEYFCINMLVLFLEYMDSEWSGSYRIISH